MTYKSDPNANPRSHSQGDETRLVSRITSELDAAGKSLPENVVSDITQARYAALRVAREQQQGAKAGKWLPSGMSSRLAWALGATPAAVALIAVVLVSYGSFQGIPELPPELVSGDLSAQDLMLVNNMELAQDLEFANWLAQQGEEDLL